MKRALAALRLCALCMFVGLSGEAFAGNGPVLDGYSVKLDITGEDVITLSELVTPGTEMSFQFFGDTEVEPVAWFVNGKQYPLPENGCYTFDVTANTTVSLLCKRPIYVSAASNPQVDPFARSYGYSRDNPCRTIQEGVDRALPTARVNVLTPGVYAPFAATNVLATKVFLFEPEDLGSSTNFPIEIRYVGTNGVASIDGGAARRCVTLSEKAVLRGFTLVNGFADRGAGVFGGSARQCVISNCVASVEGGGACASAIHYSLIVRCGVLDASGWQTGTGGGASRSQLFNCTVSACRAGAGGGVAGGSVANSIVVNSLPDCWSNLTSQVASYNQSTICFSPAHPYHLDFRFEHLGAALGSEVLETKDLDGVELPMTGLNPGCYQTIDDRNLSGVTVNGLDLVYQPFVAWNEITRTATLPATNVTLAIGGANTNLTLCSSGKTPVFFDGLVRLLAISNLTVKGGTLDSRRGWDSVIAGGSIRCDSASGFTMANGNPARQSVIVVGVPHGGQVFVQGEGGYDLRSILSNEGSIYLWVDASGALPFVYQAAHGLGVITLASDGKGGVVTETKTSLGVKVNGKDVFGQSGPGWIFDSTAQCVRFLQGRTFELSGSVDADLANLFPGLRFEVVAPAATILLADFNHKTTAPGVVPLAFLDEEDPGKLLFRGSCSLAAVGADLVTMRAGTKLEIAAETDAGASLTLDNGSARSFGVLGDGSAQITITRGTVTALACSAVKVYVRGGAFVKNGTAFGLLTADAGNDNVHVRGGVFDFEPTHVERDIAYGGLPKEGHRIAGTSLSVVGNGVTSADGALTAGRFTFDPSAAEYAAAGVRIASGKTVRLLDDGGYALGDLAEMVAHSHHCFCGRVTCPAGHERRDGTPTATLPTTAGFYYLTNDVDLAASGAAEWTVNVAADQTIVLCLNGHAIRTKPYNETIRLVQGNLKICDCQSNRGRITGVMAADVNLYETAPICVEGGVFDLYGGTLDITSAASGVRSAPAICCSGGLLNIRGGILVNNIGNPYCAAVLIRAHYGTCRVYGGVFSRDSDDSKHFIEFITRPDTLSYDPLRIYGCVYAGKVLVDVHHKPDSFYRDSDCEEFSFERNGVTWHFVGNKGAPEKTWYASFDPALPEYEALGVLSALSNSVVRYEGQVACTNEVIKSTSATVSPTRDRFHSYAPCGVTVNGEDIGKGVGSGWTRDQYSSGGFRLTLEGNNDRMYSIVCTNQLDNEDLHIVQKGYPSIAEDVYVRLTGGTVSSELFFGNFAIGGGSYPSPIWPYDATFVDDSSAHRSVKQVELDVHDFANDGDLVMLTGLENYATNDMYVCNGKIGLILPYGTYKVGVNGHPFIVTISEDGESFSRRTSELRTALQVNGVSVSNGGGEDWTYNGVTLTLNDTRTDYTITGSDEGTTVMAASGFVNVTLADGGRVKGFSVADNALLALTVQGNNSVSIGSLSVAKRGTLRLVRGTAALPAVTGDGALQICGGCWTFATDASWRRATCEGEPLEQFFYQPKDALSDKPISLTGLENYDTKDLYPIGGLLHLYLPYRVGYTILAEYETADGKARSYLKSTGSSFGEFLYGYTVNGTDVGKVEGLGWSFNAFAPKPILRLTGETDYVLLSTSRLDVVLQSTGVARLVGGTVTYPTNATTAIDGTVQLCGGNLLIDSRQFSVTPRNRTDVVYPVDLQLLTDEPSDRPLEVVGLPADYGTDGIYPVDGALRFWLPNGDYLFSIGGLRYAATVDGRGATASLAPTGLLVDGQDVCALSGEGWTWSPRDGILRIAGAHRLDGTNVLVRMTIVGGDDFAISGGSLRFEDDIRGRLVITGGNLQLPENLTVVPSNNVERVWPVTITLPAAVATNETVTVTPLSGYAAEALTPIDGQLCLWLPNGAYWVRIGPVHLGFIVDGAPTTAVLVPQGFAVDGMDIGEAVGPGWTYDFTYGELKLVSSASKVLSDTRENQSSAPSLSVIAETSQELVFTNFACKAAGDEAPALKVQTNATVTVRNVGHPVRLVAGSAGDAIGGAGDIVFAGGSFDLQGSVTVSNVTIVGGSVKCASFAVQPVNERGETLHCLRVEVPRRRETTLDTELTITGLKNYDLTSLYAIDGWAYLWLPDGDYAFQMNEDSFVGTLAGADATASPTEELAPVGVTVNGVDCGFNHDIGWRYDRAAKRLVILGSNPVVIAGTNTAGAVHIVQNGEFADLRLDNLLLAENLTSGEGAPSETGLITVKAGARARIAVLGTSTLTAGWGQAAIRVPEGARVDLGADDYEDLASAYDDDYWYGLLTATGGSGAAAIGGTGSEAVGEIVFHSGFYNLVGGDHAAAVGGGDRGDGAHVYTEAFKLPLWLMVTARGGDGFDTTGGAAIGGGYRGTGGRFDLSFGLFDLTGGAGGAGVGGGAAGSAGTTHVTSGTLIVRPGDVPVGVVRPMAIGGGSAGVTQRGGENVFTGGSVVTAEPATSIACVPSNGVSQVSAIVLTLPEDMVSPTGYDMVWFSTWLEGYGDFDLYAVDGKLTLWLPDGTYDFGLCGVSMKVTVTDGVAGPISYPSIGVTIDGVDCNALSGPGWTWSPVRREVIVTNGEHLVSGDVSSEYERIRLVLANDASVVVSNYAGASVCDPFVVAEGSASRLRFVGPAVRYGGLRGAGTCILAGGTVTFDNLESDVSVRVAGGSVYLPDGAREVRTADGSAVSWPVKIKLPTLCLSDTPVEIVGLPDWYDVGGIRAVAGEICLWLPADNYPIDVSGYDAEGIRRTRSLLVTVSDKGEVDVPAITYDIVLGEGDEMVAVPRDWVVAYELARPDASSEDFQHVLQSYSANGGTGGTKLTVWQSYVAGLVPTNAAQSFYAVIETGENGLFRVKPNVLRDGRTYKVLASETLDFADAILYPVGRDGWVVPDSQYKFFKVKVGLE